MSTHRRDLRRVRAEAASALREAAKRLAETEAEVCQLRGDAIALQEELDNRPTAAEQRCVQQEPADGQTAPHNQPVLGKFFRQMLCSMLLLDCSNTVVVWMARDVVGCLP